MQGYLEKGIQTPMDSEHPCVRGNPSASIRRCRGISNTRPPMNPVQAPRTLNPCAPPNMPALQGYLAHKKPRPSMTLQ